MTPTGAADPRGLLACDRCDLTTVGREGEPCPDCRFGELRDLEGRGVGL